MPSLAYGKLYAPSVPVIWAPSPPKRFAYLTCKALSEQCCYELFLGLGCGKLVHGVMGGTPCAGFAVLTCR